MCGMFGYAGSRPNMARVREIATLAGRRGPHACGWATAAGTVIRVNRDHGSLADHVDRVPSARMIVGHSRLSTSGGLSYRDLRDAQPLTLPGGVTEATGYVMAHNGVAKVNFAGPLDTNCDSEKLLRLTASGNLAFALAQLPDDEPYAVIVGAITGLIVARRGLPLFVKHAVEGVYLCSVPFDDATPLPEGRPTILKVTDGCEAGN